MFGFMAQGNRGAAPVAIETSGGETNQKQGADYAELQTALDAIIEGKYQSFQCEDPELCDILKEFTDKLITRQRKQLAQSVHLSAQVNEAVIAGAEMQKAGADIHQRSNGMAAAVQELTASVEQIAQNMEYVAQEARSMSQSSSKGMELSSQASSRMGDISEQVSQTVEKLERLTGAAEEITNVVGFISDIAGQTNLLALNATIEAARAGEAGKGFAVVANEVKQLARETAENAKEIIGRVEMLQQETSSITDTIHAVVEAVAQGEEAISLTNAEMQNVQALATKITEQTENVSGILSEQKVASNEVADGVSQIAAMTDSNLDKINITLDAMDLAEKTLVEEMQRFVPLEIDGLTIYLAQSDHIIWKKRLANMLVGRETLDPDELSNHHTCRLGKWYDSVQDSRYLEHPAFQNLLKPHEDVHHHGIEAARKYKDKDIDGAIEEVKKVAESSEEVIRLLQELTKV